jgi:hypothetical protein
MGPPNFFLVFLPFWRALVYLWLAQFHHTRLSIPFFSTCVFQIKAGPLLDNVFMFAIPVPSSPTCQTGYLVQIFCLWIKPAATTMQIDMDGKSSLNSFLLASS